MKCFFAIALLFSQIISFAQSTSELEKRYVNEVIYRYGSSFMKGTERLNFRDLQYQFDRSPDGLEAYTQARKYKNTATVFTVLGVAANFVTLAALVNQNRNLWWIGLGGQVVFSLGNQRYRKLSTEQTDRALWQRNKDVLFH